jgi:enoyl-CoA hydratase
MTSPQPDILFERRGAAGLVTLNRPQALNAVTLGMVRALMRQLQEWRNDPAVTRIVVTAAGGKAFSAGGDIRALYDAGTSGRHAEMLAFYGEEYTLNTVIKHYPKPYVALIDGICMGGGVGVSVHGSHRVAGDRYLFAMPEVGIGFFPDVGATWFLPRLPGELGAYCALSGDRLGAADAVAAEIATHRVASSRLADLAEALCGAAPVDAAIAAFAEPAGEGKLAPHRVAIDRLFAHDRVDPHQVADRAQACLGPNAGGRKIDIHGVHGLRIPHSVPGHSWPRFLRRGSRSDRRQGQCAALAAGVAPRGFGRRDRPAFRAARQR